MSLFDELRRQIKEAIDEANGQRPEPRRVVVRRPAPQPRQEPVDTPAVTVSAAQQRTQPAQTAPVVTQDVLPGHDRRDRLRRLLQRPEGAREAVLLGELIAPPLAMRPRGRR